MPEPAAVARLVEEGLLRAEGDGVRTTERWRAALARAAAALQRAGAPWTGLGLPVTVALAELHAGSSDEEVADSVEAMLAVEAAELGPLLGAEAAPTP